MLDCGREGGGALPQCLWTISCLCCVSGGAAVAVATAEPPAESIIRPLRLCVFTVCHIVKCIVLHNNHVWLFRRMFSFLAFNIFWLVYFHILLYWHAVWLLPSVFYTTLGGDSSLESSRGSSTLLLSRASCCPIMVDNSALDCSGVGCSCANTNLVWTFYCA